MRPFMIARVVDATTYDTLKIRLLDLDTGRIAETDLRTLNKIVLNDREEYLNSNLNTLFKDDNTIIWNFDNFPTIEAEIDPTSEKGYRIVDDNSGLVILKKFSGEDKYLISDINGNLQEVNGDKLHKYNTITNAVFDEDWSSVNKITGLFNVVIEPDIHEDTELEQKIKNQYNHFINKCHLVGQDISFEYKIKGDDVILTKYTGTSEKVIVPKFITVIGENAFSIFWEYNLIYRIKEIILNDGLKRICNKAFTFCKAKKIIIPRTVEVIERCAFYNSTLSDYNKLSEDKDERGIARCPLIKSKVTVLSRNTIVEDGFC